jgi:hypothetical protein
VTEKSELSSVLPCPFCGSSDLEVLLDHVECRACSAQGPYSSYSDDDPEEYEPAAGVELWNSRREAMWLAKSPLAKVDKL